MNTNQPINKLQIIEIAFELARYRLKQGRSWKAKLKQSFYDGSNRNCYLQMFRNHYDYSVLDSIKNTTKLKNIIEILSEGVNNG